MYYVNTNQKKTGHIILISEIQVKSKEHLYE